MDSVGINVVGLDRSRLAEKIARFIVSVILILSIVFPTAFTHMKIGLLFIVFLLILVIALANQLFMSRSLYFISLIYVIIGITGSLYGEIVGNPGAIRVLTVAVAYPLLIPFCSSLYRHEYSSSLYKIFLLCAWIIAVVDLAFVASSAVFPGNLLQNIFESLYEDWAVVDIADAYLKFTLPNVSSIIFILPFFLSVLFFSESGKVKLSILLIVFLLLAVALLSGRRGLLLSMVLGPVIAFMVTHSTARNNIKPKIFRRMLALLFITLSISSFTYISIKVIGMEYYIDLVKSMFDFTSNQSNLARALQYDALMRGIVEAPLFGHGAGAVADYVRSNEMPWAYELFYLSLVFQCGILGFLLYASGVAFILWHLISSIKKKGRSSFEFYFLSGFIAFMLATASNPYLGKFDYMWTLFIPYAIINVKLVSVK